MLDNHGGMKGKITKQDKDRVSVGAVWAGRRRAGQRERQREVFREPGVKNGDVGGWRGDGQHPQRGL